MKEYKQSLEIHVNLLDISKELKEDSDGTKIVHAVKNDILAAPGRGREFLQHERRLSIEEVGQVQHHVLRFLQTKDKYAALASMLLKSQAFHQTYNSTSEQRLMVADLPRTKYKKPYIPVVDYRPTKSSTTTEEDLHPLSVSHQFPFAGLARLDTVSHSNDDPRPHVGLDIVTFDAHNPKMYSDEREFINVFQSSFTAWEWAQIENEQLFMLNEFYVRWAMKEAYTKALGLGMGVEFNSFEMRLSRPDNNTSHDSCIWEYVSLEEKGCYVSGSIRYLKVDKEEQWEFFFLPLYQQSEETQQRSSDAKGCLCLSVGPFPKNSAPSPRFQVVVNWTNLQSLVYWHQPAATHLF